MKQWVRMKQRHLMVHIRCHFSTSFCQCACSFIIFLSGKRSITASGNNCVSVLLLSKSKMELPRVYFLSISLNTCRSNPRGVLRYISDGDVRSPFLGLKFAI